MTRRPPVHHRALRVPAAVAGLAAGIVSGLTVATPASAASGTATNPTPISITTGDDHYAFGKSTSDFTLVSPTGAASTYPSTITLDAPAQGRVSDLSVWVDLEHERVEDVDLMLVSPTGARTMLLSDAGGDNPVSGGAYFNPWYQNYPDELAIGYGSPTDWDTTPGDSDAFPAPAPAGAIDGFDSIYGTAANGAWSLYAVDDTDGSVGTIHGWEIQVHYALPASPGPSGLAVGGLPDRLTDVDLTLHDIDLGYLDDTEIVLESPDGRRAHVMSDAGGSEAVSDVTLTLDDEAEAPVRRRRVPATGTYQPVDHDDADTSEFVSGLDTSDLSSELSTFDGADPNGTWKLHVVQEHDGNSGAISGGWSLTITTSDPVPVTTPPAGNAPVVTPPVATPPVVVSSPVVVTSPDTVTPRVRAIKPRHKTTGVSTSASPTVTFSEAMRVASLEEAVQLVDRRGRKVRVTLSLDARTHVLTVDPRKDLARKATYTVVVAPSAADLAGNPLGTSSKARFTTR